MSKVLKAAIEANDPEALRKALKGVKDINRKLPGAGSPLCYASSLGADKVLGVLVEAGAIAEKRHTFPGDTPFAVAANHRQFEVMKQLLALKQVSHYAEEHVLNNACADGKADVLEAMLKLVKPPITIGLFRLSSLSSNAPAMLKLLLAHGGSVNGRYESPEHVMVTPLHELVDKGKLAVIQTLLECGADVNARDGLGRTPLMILASELEGMEFHNQQQEELRQLRARGKALAEEPPARASSLELVQYLLDSGADAKLVDDSGNDAIDHYNFAFLYNSGRRVPSPEILEVLRKAGAKGSASTLQLFVAIKNKDFDALHSAIANGADVNRLTPTSITPLTCALGGDEAIAAKFVQALLKAGADPSKSSGSYSPLIHAARSGHLQLVKMLVEAGADIHKVYEVGDCIENAYSAAEGNDELRKYLKLLGAQNPVSAKSASLKPGVESWNDFSELLVKATVGQAAEGLAKLINGKVQSDVYGQSLSLGKKAYVVVRPKGMDWCNIFQIAPPPKRFEDSKKTEAFASEVAKACGASVLAIDYSDTSDAASIVRIEPSGKKTENKGWDRDTLEEMVSAMGDKAPAWARKQLAKTDEDTPSSTERLEMLAEQEKFVVAAFGFGGEPGFKVDVEFTGYGAETFDGVALVSS